MQVYRYSQIRYLILHFNETYIHVIVIFVYVFLNNFRII
jgi:hypothetical protein